MKREIIFRGKRLDNRQWVYGYYVLDPNANHRIYLSPFAEATSNTYFFVDPQSVGEYTSIKDVNKKNIYEGDLVCFHKREYRVVFNDACYYLFYENGLKEIDDTPYRWGRLYRAIELDLDLKIIGNIYEQRK